MWHLQAQLYRRTAVCRSDLNLLNSVQRRQCLTSSCFLRSSGSSGTWLQLFLEIEIVSKSTFDVFSEGSDCVIGQKAVMLQMLMIHKCKRRFWRCVSAVCRTLLMKCQA
jgi:hypothetical protein